MSADRLIVFLVKRICAFARLAEGASPSFKLFWLGQIETYHNELRKAMVNPVFKGVQK